MKPILFNDEMVRAILSGRKTQTRRPLKPQTDSVQDGVPYWNIECPFGKVGDLLWVREAFTLTILQKKAIYRAVWKNPDGIKWTSSIHMPKWASRITLEITEVRVERLQEITASDCMSEGIPHDENGISSRVEFATLWNSIYEKKGLGWNINPWIYGRTPSASDLHNPSISSGTG